MQFSKQMRKEKRNYGCLFFKVKEPYQIKEKFNKLKVIR